MDHLLNPKETMPYRYSGAMRGQTPVKQIKTCKNKTKTGINRHSFFYKMTRVFRFSAEFQHMYP